MQNENNKIPTRAANETNASGSKQKTIEKNKAVVKKTRTPKARTPKTTEPKIGMTAPKKIKLLFTIVNRQKTDFFVDVLQEFEVNMQLILSAQGTAKDQVMAILGLTDSDKSVIISVIRQDKIKDALATLGEKFNTVKGGKGIAYTVPIKSAIGVAIYRFLSNTSGGGLING